MLKSKDLFNLPEPVCYLNSAFISPQLKTVTQRGIAAVPVKEQPWALQVSDFFTECDYLRATVGNLMRVSGEQIALIPAVSYGVETAVKNLPLKPGQKVLMPADEFPSNVYPWLAACKEQGALPLFVPKPTDFDWTSAFLAAIDADTAVVSVPQTDWSDGSHFDLVAIHEKVKSVGAALVVDLSQSFGVSPVDVTAFDPDFAFSVGYKWQLGPYGVSYMYVAKRHLQGKPLENNWLNRKTSADLTRLTEYTEEYALGARRFDSGQHSHFVLNPMAVQATDLLRELTPKRIFEHITGLNKKLDAGLQELGFSTVPVNRRTGHMMGAHLAKDICVKELCADLQEESIFVSVRTSGLRISPHIYNTEADIEKCLRALKKALGSAKTN